MPFSFFSKFQQFFFTFFNYQIIHKLFLDKINTSGLCRSYVCGSKKQVYGIFQKQRGKRYKKLENKQLEIKLEHLIYYGK